MAISTSNIQESTHWLTDVVEINRRVKATLEGEHGLSVTQFRALLELRVNEGHLACGTLATLLFVSPSAITHALDELVQRGYVTRYSMESNRRVVLADITTQGREALAQANEHLGDLLHREAWSTLTPSEIGRLQLATSMASGPFVGHTLLHQDLPFEPCYITCALIQQECYEQLLRKNKISLAELRLAILALGAPEGLSNTDAAAELVMDRRALSRAAIALRKRGALVDVESPDGRNLFTLTEEGRQITLDLFERIAVIDARICEPSGTSMVEEINELSEKVYQSLRATL